MHNINGKKRTSNDATIQQQIMAEYFYFMVVETLGQRS